MCFFCDSHRCNPSRNNCLNSLHVRHNELEGGGALIQVYTGNGKGKTTAALGLAVRAAGAGKKVYIAQFVKGRKYSELNALRKIKNIKLERFGRTCFIKKEPCKKDIESAKCGLVAVKRALKKKYGLIILDEINIALGFNLLKLKDVLKVIREAPAKTELILTGRNAPSEIIKIADLVSEVKEIKHYFQKGVKGRKGIEF